jgi:hypothetical protein
MMAALTACSDAAPAGGEAPAPAPANTTPSAACTGDCYPVPSVKPDIVSGCVEGSPLVKVLIRLTSVDGKCHADVTPASVCVQQGGVIRWRVDNYCGSLIKPGLPLLEITVPTYKPLGNPREKAESQDLKNPPKLESCALKTPKVEDRPKTANVLLFCEVDPKAPYGFYKYGLTGQIDPPLDPDVEVRGGR